MQRVMIIGGPGSGKTTLARKLADVTDLPVYHIDSMIFHENWKVRPNDEVLESISKVVANQSWILEGFHELSYGLQKPRADTIIFIDIPTHIRLWRVLKRSLMNFGKPLPEHAVTCKMTFKWWLVMLTLKFNRHGRPGILTLMRTVPNGGQCLYLTTTQQIEAFVSGISDVNSRRLSRDSG